jgi:hypothetical protein
MRLFGRDGLLGRPSSDSSLSGELIATHPPSQWARAGALLCAAGALLVFGLVAVRNRPLLSWWTLLDLATTGVPMVVGAAYGLRAQIEVYEDGVRRVHPLWRNHALRFADVERALLPTTRRGLLLFTGAAGSPQFGIDGDTFEDVDALIRRVLRRLPDDVAVEDPAGRLDDLRRDDQGSSRPE